MKLVINMADSLCWAERSLNVEQCGYAVVSAGGKPQYVVFVFEMEKLKVAVVCVVKWIRNVLKTKLAKNMED